MAWGIEGAPDTLEALHDGLTALLDGAAGGNKRVLLFVDEAQSLSRDLLAEIGRLAVMAGEPRSPARLSILLVGQDQLGTVLSRPENAELAKRVGARYVTEPLTGAEVREYVAHRLARDGREARGVHGRRAAGARHRLARHPTTDQLDRRPCPSQHLAGGNGGYRCRSGAGMRAPTRASTRPTPPGATPTTRTRMALPRRTRLGLALHSGSRSADSPRGVRLRDGLAARSHAEVNTNARPAAALVPASPGSSGSATPTEAPRVSEPGRSAAAAPGPPDGSVHRPVDPPPTAQPAAPRASEPGPSAAVAPGPPVGSVHRPVDPPPTARPAAPRAREPGPSAAVAPGPPVGSVHRPVDSPPTARPAAPRAREPRPSAVAVPGPPVGSVQPAPVPPAPIRPLPRPAAEGTTARSGSPADAAPAARTQVVTAPTSSGARRPPEVQAAEESDPGGIIDWLLSEYPARRQ